VSIRLFVAAQQGGAGSVASGELEFDFGSAPGTDMVSIAVAHATTTVNTIVTAFVLPKITANKSIDEQIIDSIDAKAHDPVAGVGFTITARSTAGLLMGIYNVGWLASE
jgi:hypothetical protein